jgi:hypothetical protein
METVNDRSPASDERDVAAQVAYEVAKSLYFEERLRRPSSTEVMTLTQKTIHSAPVYDPYKGITPEYIEDLLKHCVNTPPYGRPRTVRRGQDLCTSLLDWKCA